MVKINARDVIPGYMLTAEQVEDVIQYLHAMPIPVSERQEAFRWWAGQTGHATTDEDLRRLES